MIAVARVTAAVQHVGVGMEAPRESRACDPGRLEFDGCLEVFLTRFPVPEEASQQAEMMCDCIAKVVRIRRMNIATGIG